MSISSTGARIISFNRTIEARAEEASAKVRGNAQTVELPSGQVVHIQSARITSAEHAAVAQVDEHTQYFADAELTGVPVRVIHQAWDNYRQAVSDLGQHAITVHWPSDVRDCRAIELRKGGARAGIFSILDGNRPRSAEALRVTLKSMVQAG